MLEPVNSFFLATSSQSIYFEIFNFLGRFVFQIIARSFGPGISKAILPVFFVGKTLSILWDNSYLQRGFFLFIYLEMCFSDCFDYIRPY